MKFTRSRDGRPRSNVNVRFRVGLDALETAAAYSVWSELAGQQADDELDAEADRVAGDLTRTKIERELRGLLQSYGYELVGSLAEDEFWDRCAQPARERVHELYPELLEEEA